MAYSEVERIAGEKGDFTVTVRRKARYVDESKCTGCGACSEKCPTTVSDDYNMGLAQRKAIYRYFAQGIPSTYTIDASVCRNFQQGKKCGICAKVCQAKAVDYKQQDRLEELKVGAVIVAVGYDLFDPSVMAEYGYGRIANVITALEFERLLSASGPTGGHLYCPSDLRAKAQVPVLEKELKKVRRTLNRFEKEQKRSSEEFWADYQAGRVRDADLEAWVAAITAQRSLNQRLEAARARAGNMKTATRLAFIQCVGSRDVRHSSHCSAFCCMHAIKEAIIAKEHNPEAEALIFAMDVRSVGKGFEEYRLRGRDQAGIRYIRSRVAEITSENGDLPVVWYEDTREREVRRQEVDLVILASACQPSRGVQALAECLGVELNSFGFFKTDPFNPLDTTRSGIFVCGCANSPMDIPESVAQASSAAARAAQALGIHP